MKDKETAPHFRGVFARNALPSRPRKGFYIMNFDKTGQLGSHWVSMEIGKKYNMYFDSYGREPPTFPHLTKFLAGKLLRRNRKQVQHEYSMTCGQWCVYFIWRRCNGWSLASISQPFKSEHRLLNDHVMNHLIQKRFRLRGKVINKPFLKEQICREMAQNLAEWCSRSVTGNIAHGKKKWTTQKKKLK